MTLFVEKFPTNSLQLSHTAYGFLFRQNPQGYFLPLMGFQLSGRGRSLIHEVFGKIIGNFLLSLSFLLSSHFLAQTILSREIFFLKVLPRFEPRPQQSFSDYMEKGILKPLGMEQSSFDWEAIAASGRTDKLATSFDEELQPSPHRRYTATAAASLYATPQDMARFVQAYSRKNLVLKQETLKQMMQPQLGAHQDWGLGHTLYVAVLMSML